MSYKSKSASLTFRITFVLIEVMQQAVNRLYYKKQVARSEQFQVNVEEIS